ncbi:Uncharacterised protein [[Pasteurella] mairii]|uniref:Uncharacterized protein n=1 Tax=[Pasteurella] mairii TaxID=757 RepID=A0A379B508_9PAST|nr:Uncharacterised protein [[Pasteurella] mairii]
MAFLYKNLEEIHFFHNGLPKITSLEDELPLISVFINNAEADQYVIGYQEWHTDLNILTYIVLMQSILLRISVTLCEDSVLEITIQLSKSFQKGSLNTPFFKDIPFMTDDELRLYCGPYADTAILNLMGELKLNLNGETSGPVIHYQKVTDIQTVKNGQFSIKQAALHWGGGGLVVRAYINNWLQAFDKTEEEHLRYRILALEAENAYLKKLREFNQQQMY